jgi:hypothetical protein
VHEFFILALPLGLGTARALDVRAGTTVAALEKRDTRPDVDRFFVFACELVIQARQQELLDARLAVRIGRRAGAGWVDWQRLRHHTEWRGPPRKRQ